MDTPQLSSSHARLDRHTSRGAALILHEALPCFDILHISSSLSLADYHLLLALIIVSDSTLHLIAGHDDGAQVSSCLPLQSLQSMLHMSAFILDTTYA